MLFIIFKKYPYSAKATFVSLIGSGVGLALIISSVALLGEGMRLKDTYECIGAVILAAIGLMSYFYVSKKLSKKIAEKEAMNNVRTKASYGYQYVLEHPEAYDMLVRENKAFAAKYVRTADGKIVRRQ